jgi:hypothetical protein
MNPELELFLIAFISGAATMLLIVVPIWLHFDKKSRIQHLIDTAASFDRGYDLARKQTVFVPHSTCAKE